MSAGYMGRDPRSAVIKRHACARLLFLSLAFLPFPVFADGWSSIGSMPVASVRFMMMARVQLLDRELACAALAAALAAASAGGAAPRAAASH